jgi:APA family basic amino acid/polyamine antiporter
VVAERLFGFVAGNALAIFTIVAWRSISAMVLAGPRVYFAMARDHVFLESASWVPSTARHAGDYSAAVWSVLVLCGSLSGLVAYTAFASLLFSGIAVLSLQCCGGVSHLS